MVTTTQEKAEELHWHAISVEHALARTASSKAGLTPDEVARRLAEHGSNRLPAAAKRGPLRRFLSQFNNLLIYVLLGAAGLTAGLGHWIDTAVILAVVMVNAVIGFIQEGKAEKALDAIRDMLSPQAMVVRDGRRMTVAAEELVPGDIVFLQSGDKVPADLRLVEIKGLQAQEAALTGESLATEKSVTEVEPGAPLGDRRSMAYSGTLITHGQGLGVVIATGAHTELGRISSMLATVEELTTPLLRQMAVFARYLTVAILLLAATTFVFGVFVRDYTPAEMFLAAVGLAVAAIPEGLPAIMTVALAIGVQAMARRNAIIRRLPAVETLGSVSVICSDKTGTLTRNEMTVQAVATAEHEYEISGAGYEPHGVISYDGSQIGLAQHPLLRELLRAGLLCNDATLRVDGEHWHLEGDPTEGALLTAALKAGLEQADEIRAYPRTDLIPFESEHRFMATLHHDHQGNGFIFVKGAPERILQMCSHERTPGGERALDEAAWHQRIDALASRGHRVLAIATRPTLETHRNLHFGDVESDLILLGLVGLIDPPRPEAIAAVAQCQAAGIRVKMITGDHAATAGAVARQLGIASDGRVLTGTELDAMSDQELAGAVEQVAVFARTSPEHKLRLVQAMQAQGRVIAMTGDGVNDAPALKRADIGIAMGIKGTEAAKEASEMVLADDNFASIVNAVEEGRRVYDNLKKAILFLLPVNAGESLTLIIAILLGYEMPITPLQILWVNMVSSVALALALAFEPAERDVMRRPPRPSSEPLLSGFLFWRIALVAAVFMAGVFGSFIWYREFGTGLEEARTIAVNTLVMFEVFYLLTARQLLASSLAPETFAGNRRIFTAIGIVLLLQAAFTYLPPMQALFQTVPLEVHVVGGIVLVAVSVFFVVELEKLVRRRRLARAPA